MTESRVHNLFGCRKPVVVVIHLLPLPGSPRWGGSIVAVCDRAVADAHAAQAGGADGLIVENYGDTPFHKDTVPAVTIAAMTRVVTAVRENTMLPVGVNVLRNAATAALSIASVCGGAFIRVNVHTGIYVTDQGIIEGRADDTMRLRQMIAPHIAVFADVFVKHASPIGVISLDQVARDCAYRGVADALIVTGESTGAPADLHAVETVQAAVADRPVLIGSGVTPENVGRLLQTADGVIVGTSVKKDAVIEAPVDSKRVEALCRAAGR